jgi:hypothetical protein
MYKDQVLSTNPDEFSWCKDQTWLQTNCKKSRSPIQKMDAVIEEKINHALWNDDVLRVIYNNEIDIHVPGEYQQVDIKIENVPNQVSSTLKTEEQVLQVLSEELLANDSLGG